MWWKRGFRLLNGRCDELDESLTSSLCKCSFWHLGLQCVFTTALTQRCPGQIGGGWEESDSGNSSSHNSSQDIAANSRASVGSKSAGTGSQSGASRESSGDLSERWVAVFRSTDKPYIFHIIVLSVSHAVCLVSRVEALQLGDCGQEMALISRLTEGSRVFLSREESQHFIKESVDLKSDWE